LTQEVVAGGSITTTISFSSSEKITDVWVKMSDELGRIIMIAPVSLGTVSQKQTVSLAIVAHPAATTLPSVIQGTISLYRKTPSRDIPYGLPLAVYITVSWPVFTDPGHSYTIAYPPALTATFDSSYNDLLLEPSSNPPDTESPGIVISKEPNPENLSVTEFFDGDHGSDLVGQSLGIFSTSTLPSGAIAYRFDPVVTLAGGVVVVIPGSQEFVVVKDQSGGHSGDINAILNSLTLY